MIIGLEPDTTIVVKVKRIVLFPSCYYGRGPSFQLRSPHLLVEQQRGSSKYQLRIGKLKQQHSSFKDKVKEREQDVSKHYGNCQTSIPSRQSLFPLTMKLLFITVPTPSRDLRATALELKNKTLYLSDMEAPINCRPKGL